jgi:TPR repeat protein
MDPALAQLRAAEYLKKGLDLFHEEATAEEKALGCEALLLATDFGCPESPFLLVLQILSSPDDPVFPHRDLLNLLRLAAERGNGRAAYRLAASYAQMNHFPTIELLGEAHFACLPAQDRVRLAEYYFAKAIAAGNDEAIDELIMAYAYGRGLIAKNSAKFQRLCETLVSQGKQTVTIGYGAWLCGMAVNGKPLLAEVVDVPKDSARGLDYLLKASRGDKLNLAQQALKLVLMAQSQGALESGSVQQLQRRLFKEAKDKHPLLALYFAWYSTPTAMRRDIPSFIAEEPLPQLQHFVVPHEDLAIKWLDLALFVGDSALANAAKLLLANLFVKVGAKASKKVVDIGETKTHRS